MIKKFTVFAAGIIMMFSLVACSSGADEGQTQIETGASVETTAAPEDIGEAKARAIALERVPGATDNDIISFEKDIDDGYAEYEGEIFYDGTEYEFEISASDGSILSWEIDRD